MSQSRTSQLARASVGTGLGTLLSRLSGLVRLVALAAALGGGALANGFNLANTTPNMIHDLVLGGIMGATFVPVFVERIAKDSVDEAVESISAVLTIALGVVLSASVLLWLLAPAVIDAYTTGASAATPAARTVAIELLRWFAPQVLFYGVIGLMSAVLATRDRFAIVGIVPVVNNLVNIAVFAVFAVLAHNLSRGGVVSVEAAAHDQTLIVVLGLGTTLGVVLQALCLIPAFVRSGLRLRFVWRPRDRAVRMIVSLSSWTIGFVVANQIAAFVVLALEYHLGHGSLTAYTYAYQFFLFPFAVVAVSVINVASPDMARAWAGGDLAMMGERFSTATRQTLALVLPATVGYLLLARPAMELVIQHGAETGSQARVTASVLELFALGLPGFCVFFLATRAFQAMQDTRTAFVCYALENGTNVLMAIVLYGPLGVRGLAIAYSVAYTVAAIVAVAVLHERLGRIGGRLLLGSLVRSVMLCAAMALAVAFVEAVIGTGAGLLGWVRLFVATGAGVAVYLGGAGLAGSVSAWQTSRRRPLERRGGSRGRHGRHSGSH